MGNVAVKVENLGKMYHIGTLKEPYQTLRGAFVSGLKKLVARRSDSGAEKNTIWALKEVSFEVKQGEIVGVIGRNGAGKSTLLKVLAHITEPTIGRVSLYGRVGSLLEVGTGFHPELTGRDNIYLNGAILGMKRAEIQRKFDEIVAFAEIEKFLDTPVKHYSSGMYVRLAFAVAAHLEPEILLVDEVLAVGDAVFQKKCLGKIGSVAEQGRTVLFVTHNLQAITSLCRKGILLYKGSVIYQGTTSKVVERYLLDSSNELVLEQEIENNERRLGEGTVIRLTHVSISFPNGSSEIWEPLQFTIKFKCLAKECIFGMSIEVWRLDNSCVFTTDTEDDGIVFNMAGGTKGSALVYISDPNLPPDRYIVRAVARSGGKVIDWIDNALVFDILNKENISVRVSERHLGSRVRGKWRTINLSQES